ncbi:MAG: hypothetical protein IID43_07200 [Planctomycetes bacterium]|nr:hypothetical protein [Planctomycetota bacterium]
MILALLARVPFADGLLLHDHSDHGVHSHTVTLDDLREGDLRAVWHRHHDDDRDDRNNDSDGGESRRAGTDSLLIFVSDPANAAGIHGSSGTVIASIRPLSSSVLPRSMLPSDPTESSRFLTAPWPSARPLRPAFALDALLQSSHALLL